MTAHASVRARRRPVVLAALVALASSAPAVAQTQLYLLSSGADVQVPVPECEEWEYWYVGCNYNVVHVPGRVIQLDVDRRQIVANTTVSHALGAVIGPRPTPDGRFLLWSGSSAAAAAPYRVSLFDIARRQQATPFAASVGPGVPLTVHPSAMRAFLGLTPGQVTVAEPGQTFTLPSPPCSQPSFSGRSGDGQRLSYRCPDPQGLLVVDSADGHLIGTVPHAATSHLLDEAGTTVFGADWDRDGLLPTVVRRYDVVTGAVLAERQANVAGFNAAVWSYHPATGHLYVGGRSGDIVVLDASSLQEVGRIPNPWPTLPYALMALDPDRPEAYVGWHGTLDNRNIVRVSLVHTGTFATIGSMDIPIDAGVVGMVLGPRPPRVADLGALVDGRLVTLSWTIDASHSIATEQVVEVGFAHGQTLVRLPVSADASSLAVAGAPPGRYYVRIRTTNGTGVGAPSNEVIVDVQ